MEETNELKQEMPIKAEDEVSQVTTEQMIETLEADIVTVGNAIKDVQADRENYQAQVDVDTQIRDIINAPGNFKPLNPNYVFEEDEKYWELQLIKRKFQQRQEEAVAEGQFRQYDHQEAQLNAKLEASQEKLNLVKGN